VHTTDNDGTTPPPAPQDGSPPDLAQLRRLARYQRTTAVLERRADRSASAPLAAVLRERAAARRHLADGVRARLAAQRHESA
jgi:hypothetical protein